MIESIECRWGIDMPDEPITDRDLQIDNAVPSGTAVIHGVWGHDAHGKPARMRRYKVPADGFRTVGELWRVLELVIRADHIARGESTRMYWLERVKVMPETGAWAGETHFEFGT